MAGELDGRRVAVLATDGFEQIELTEPVAALQRAGAQVEIVAPKEGQIQGWNHHDRGDAVPVDRVLDQADPDDYDALVLPGGVISPATRRWSSAGVRHLAQPTTYTTSG